MSELIPQPHGGALSPAWSKGQTGNPKGRPSLGATVQEHANGMGQAGLTEAELIRIQNDPSEPFPRRMAAEWCLFSLSGDIADFEGWLKRKRSLRGLKRSGIPTRLIKRAKIRYIPTETGTIEERELELKSVHGEYLDRVMDRTEGKPTQKIEHTGDVGLTVKRVILELPTQEGQS